MKTTLLTCTILAALSGCYSSDPVAGMYAGVAVVKSGGKIADVEMIGATDSQAKCEKGVATLAADPANTASPGVQVELYCAALGAPVATIGK